MELEPISRRLESFDDMRQIPYSEASGDISLLGRIIPDARTINSIDPFSIIGTDDRTRVADTEAWPFSAIGKLVLNFPGGTVIGSGTLIGSHHVLTAGHCIYDHKRGGWLKSGMFYPAQNQSVMPFGSSRVRKVVSVSGWVEKANPDFDMGILLLVDNLGLLAGALGCDVLSNDALLNKTVSVAGYPSDKGGNEMWTHAEKIKTVTDEQLRYEVDTFGGQSGSGVIMPSTTGIVGVHTGGSSTANGGVRITAEKLAFIKRQYAE